MITLPKLCRYDFLIVGAGLFGCVFARQAAERGKRVLVIDSRDHIGGNCYTEVREGIPVHIYGPHLFHCAKKEIWDYVNRFAEFNRFSLRTKVTHSGRVFSFPVNLMTLNQLWGVRTPEEAERKLAEVRVPCADPKNLEEWALAQVGEELYETFIRGYTAKQWGRDPKCLPTGIIKRLPIRLTYNDRYFHDSHRYEGVPIGGYTPMFAAMLDHTNIHLRLGVDYFEECKNSLSDKAERIVYTGPIDKLFSYCYGRLDYRSLRFEHEARDGDFQGCAVMNYTEESVPYTRIVEHKHFECLNNPRTIITHEFPDEYGPGKVPYYPVGDEANSALYTQYRHLADVFPTTILGGRLADYRYYDMHQVVASALHSAEVHVS